MKLFKDSKTEKKQSPKDKKETSDKKKDKSAEKKKKNHDVVIGKIKKEKSVSPAKPVEVPKIKREANEKPVKMEIMTNGNIYFFIFTMSFTKVRHAVTTLC